MPIWMFTPLKTIVSGYTKAHGMAMIVTIFANKERGIMDLFKRKKTKPSESSIIAAIDDQLADDKEGAYNNTLNYLVGLTDDEYEKMLKCAKIYREADKKVAAVMEVKAPNGGEVIEVRVEKKDESSEFLETDDQKGKKKSA